MNDRRKNLVVKAFRILDRDGSGFIETAEVANRLDYSKHPDVLAKKKTEGDLITEFLNHFEGK